MKVSFSDETLVFALGGLGEVGKNMYCIEHKDNIFIIDAGVKFPEAELLGIDSIPHKGMKLYTGEFITVVGVFFKDFGPVLTLIFLFYTLKYN